MSDLSEKLSKILNGISDFVINVDSKMSMLSDIVTQRYSVTHAPEMRLGMRDEFDFILETLKPTTRKSMALVRGCADNGSVLRLPQKCSEVYIYDRESGGYKQMTGEYLVRCDDERGKEFLTLLYVQTDYDLADDYDGELTVPGADCPLTDTEILLHIGTDTRLQPNVDELLERFGARSLYVFSANPQYGSYVWELTGPSTITSLYVQKNLTVLSGATFNIPSIEELYLPNAANVPSASSKNGLRKVDITNAQVLSGSCFKTSMIGSETDGKVHINAIQISSNVFQNCIEIKQLTMSENVKTIGDNAFYTCYSLKTITLGTNTEKLGVEAFAVCPILEVVNLGSKLSSMTNSSFNGCSKIEKITVGKGYRCLQNYFTSAAALAQYDGATDTYKWECMRDIIDNSADLTTTDKKGYWHLPSAVLTLINGDTDFIATAAAKGWYFTT